MEQPTFFDLLFEALPTVVEQHCPTTSLSCLLKFCARQEIERLFDKEQGLAAKFGPFGELVFPFHPMGAADSRNLFDLDELIIFSFYLVNKANYRKVLDLGANLGLHSIILSRCGFQVTAYEPDPVHYKLLVHNLAANNIATVSTVNKAISTIAQQQQFIRVLGNTTSSHLAGAKENPYGELEYIDVETAVFKELIGDVDLIKMDIEGHEKEVLLSTNGGDWQQTDAIVEVGSTENADAIFSHFQTIKVNLFAQKLNWQKIESKVDMPTSYRDGSLFITAKDQMPWPDAWH